MFREDNADSFMLSQIVRLKASQTCRGVLVITSLQRFAVFMKVYC